MAGINWNTANMPLTVDQDMSAVLANDDYQSLTPLIDR
jgi:hypothetical protein